MRSMKFAVLIAALIVAGAVCRADAIYQVRLDTSFLAGVPNLYLDFQFTDGSGAPNNTAHAVFDFGGGMVGTPALNGTGVAYNAGTLDMDGSEFFQEAVLPFSAGDSVTFLINFSENADDWAPDTFSFGILQGTCPGGTCVDIADPNANFAPAFFQVELPTPWSSTNVLTSGSTQFNVPLPLVNTPESPAPVPEPSTAVLLVSAVACCGRLLRRRNR